ncbi:hypothetical protein [Paenibacillus thermotolerans]|uniref:hypothetical protein n=1 Tax=Paenibacillus thermotolerans TaxID=3027807 RepID=UPI002368558A|nr:MULTISPECIES: hypothetical protein [unclassified Paenibacillus]
MGQISMQQLVIDDISDAALFDLTTGDPAAVFERLQQLNFQIPVNQTRVYGGTSRFAFHLTQQDSEGSVTATNAVLDFNQLKMATGADVTTGSQVVPTMEKHTVDAAAGTVTLKKASSLVADSEKVLIATKGLTNSGKILERVASAPTADQYSIAAGVITFGDTNLKGKEVRVFYDYTATSAERASLRTSTKNKAYRFQAYGKVYDDELDKMVDVAIVIYKTQMLGTFSIDQQRKTATTNSFELAILDPGRADEMVIDIYAV